MIGLRSLLLIEVSVREEDEHSGEMFVVGVDAWRAMGWWWWNEVEDDGWEASRST